MLKRICPYFWLKNIILTVYRSCTTKLSAPTTRQSKRYFMNASGLAEETVVNHIKHRILHFLRYVSSNRKFHRICRKGANCSMCSNDRDNNVLPLAVLRSSAKGSSPRHSLPCNCDIPRGQWKRYIFWCTHPQRPLILLSQIITGNVIIHKLSLCKVEIK